jgi:hypothetical protein
MSATRSLPPSPRMRGEAEDLAASVIVDYEVLDAVVDPSATCTAALPSSTALGRQSLSRADDEGGDIEATAGAAEITVTCRYRMNRQSGAPLEGVLRSPTAAIGSMKS